MNAILVIEDTSDTQLLLKKTLAGVATQVIVAGTASEARTALRTVIPDLIVLDISLPDGDGIQLCSEFLADERTKEIPILFLTGKTDVSYKLAAFSMGAEDYIEKPFNPLELRARVQARLKKAQSAKSHGETLTREFLLLDAPTQRAFNIEGGERRPIKLTPREFKLLFHLARNEDHVLTRDQLLTAVWGDAVEVFDRTVDAHISSLRKKLGTLARYILSVQGVGYRFSVTEGAAAQSLRKKAS